jgi:uncharacterized RDD family membrane protein YckC
VADSSVQARKEVVVAAGGYGVPVVGTQENVHVTGRRIPAIIVDGLLIGIPVSLLSMLFGTNEANGGNVSVPLVSLSTLIFFLYFVLLEGYLGQTVGKMLLGIKVIREDNGEVPGIGTAVIRTLLRLIDGLFAYLVGFIVVLSSSKRQRLGDMAAHTLVVRK